MTRRWHALWLSIVVLGAINYLSRSDLANRRPAGPLLLLAVVVGAALWYAIIYGVFMISVGIDNAGLMARYEGFLTRRASRSLGEEQARRESHPRAVLNLLLFPWTCIVAAAAWSETAGNPYASSVLYGFAIIFAPLVAWGYLRFRRVKRHRGIV